MKVEIHFTLPLPRDRRSFQNALVAEAWLTSQAPAPQARPINTNRYEYLRIEAQPPTPSREARYQWSTPPRFHYPMRIVGLMIFADSRGLFEVSGSTARANEEPVTHLEDFLTPVQKREIFVSLWNYYKTTLTQQQQDDELGTRVYACLNAMQQGGWL